MSFKNHLHRGTLILAAHLSQDVFAQLPVGDRGAEQTDEYELELVGPPLPAQLDPANFSELDRQAFLEWYEAKGVTIESQLMGDPNRRDRIFAREWAKEHANAHYRAHYPDFDLTQGAAHLVTREPNFMALNLDVRTIKHLRAQYHDSANRDDTPYLDTYAQLRDIRSYKSANNEADQAYVVMVVVEYEELLTPPTA